MTEHDHLCGELRGCSVILEIDSISHLPSHNCYLVNDAFLLSYGQAHDILKRSKAAQKIAGKVSMLAERFMGWLFQAIYRCCFTSQTPVKMEKSDAQGLPQSQAD